MLTVKPPSVLLGGPEVPRTEVQTSPVCALGMGVFSHRNGFWGAKRVDTLGGQVDGGASVQLLGGSDLEESRTSRVAGRKGRLGLDHT